MRCRCDRTICSAHRYWLADAEAGTGRIRRTQPYRRVTPMWRRWTEKGTVRPRICITGKQRHNFSKVVGTDGESACESTAVRTGQFVINSLEHFLVGQARAAIGTVEHRQFFRIGYTPCSECRVDGQWTVEVMSKQLVHRAAVCSLDRKPQCREGVVVIQPVFQVAGTDLACRRRRHESRLHPLIAS